MSGAPRLGHAIPSKGPMADGEEWTLLNVDLSIKLWMFAQHGGSRVANAIDNQRQQAMEGGFSIEWGAVADEEVLYEHSVGTLVKPNNADEKSIFRDVSRFRLEDKLNAVITNGKRRVEYSGMYDSLKKMLHMFDTVKAEDSKGKSPKGKSPKRTRAQLAELTEWNKQWVKDLMVVAMKYKTIFGMCPYAVQFHPRHEQWYITVPDWGTGVFVARRLPEGGAKYGWAMTASLTKDFDMEGAPTHPAMSWSQTRPDINDQYNPFNSVVSRLFPTWLWFRRQLRFADNAARIMANPPLMLMTNSKSKPAEELATTELFATTLAERQMRKGQGTGFATATSNEHRQIVRQDREAISRQDTVFQNTENDKHRGHPQFRMDLGIDSHMHLYRVERPWLNNSFYITGGMTTAPYPQPKIAIDALALRAWWASHVSDAFDRVVSAGKGARSGGSSSKTVAEARTVSGLVRASIDDWREDARFAVTSMWFFLLKEKEYGTLDTMITNLDGEHVKAKLLLDFYEKVINESDPTLELRRLREAGIVKLSDFDESMLATTINDMATALEVKRKPGQQTIAGAPEDFDEVIATKKAMERARAIHQLQSLLETDELIKRRDAIAETAEKMEIQVDREKLMAVLIQSRTDKQREMDVISRKREFVEDRQKNQVNLAVTFTAVYLHDDVELFMDAYDRGVYSFDVLRAITNHRLRMPPDTPSGKPLDERKLELAKFYAIPKETAGAKRPAASGGGGSSSKKAKTKSK